MSDLNCVCLIGRLTSNPEYTVNKKGTSILEFRLASNRIYYQEDRQKVEDSCFIDCVVFGQQAETMSKHLTEGKTLSLRGRLRYEEWGTEDERRSKHSIVVEDLNFVGPKNNGGEESTKERPRISRTSRKTKEVPF